MADIADIKAGDRWVEILNPRTDEPVGIRFNIVSIDDEKLARIKRKITDQRLHLEARGKTFKAEEIEDNKSQLLFAATLGWDWYNPTGVEGDKGYDEKATPDFHGSVPEFNKRNFDQLINELPWLADQVNEAVGDTKSFFILPKSI